ncbi:MAG: NAD(P)/FAD-dependent oxidoreductase [Nitrospira sp.]
MSEMHRVVVIGGGFGGMYAAKALGNAPGIQVTLIDRRNFHLFQPLLYQVATAGLSPGEIASPLRAVLRKFKNITVLMAEVTGFDLDNQRVILSDGEIPYDSLIVATGSRHSYFGRDEWEQLAPGLKTIEDALDIRRRIFLAYEAAEREQDPVKRKAWLTFVVVGGGPTGVELAGALGEIASQTLKGNFRRINPAEAQVLLIENDNRVLPPYPPELSAKARKALERLGVTPLLGGLVTDVRDDEVVVKFGDEVRHIPACTVLWAAGVQASPLARKLGEAVGAELDRAGRIKVHPNLTLPGHPEVFVIGDMTSMLGPDGKPLPGVAPVAMQQGRYAARAIRGRLKGQGQAPFRYQDKGSMATIGPAAAVVHMGLLRFNGYLAWLTWLFVHLLYIAEFDNRLLILVQWAWNYFTRNRGARLITGSVNAPPLTVKEMAKEEVEVKEPA